MPLYPEARIWKPEELRAGLRAEFEREVGEADVLGFARNSGDWNPLHVDAAHAQNSNFQGRIVHGAFQVGLASALVGMHLPGRHVLLGSVNARFPSPLYYPCRVCVRGEMTSWDAERQAGQVRVVVQEASSRATTAEIVLAVTLHQSGRGRTPSPSALSSSCSRTASEKVLLITGASGGLGEAMLRALAANFSILGMTNRRPLPQDLAEAPGVAEVRADLGESGWEDRVRSALGDRSLYGVIHAAWPGAPHGGLLQCPDDLIEQQLRFGSVHLIRLARLLASCVGDQGGRLIALGSIVGSARPSLPLAAYSLGKATLESTLRLLAPELARKQVTVNAVCPGFVPVGINRAADDRQQKLESSRIPLGRLCSPADVTGAVEYLLSPTAAFVSGQILGLSGGQL